MSNFFASEIGLTIVTVLSAVLTFAVKKFLNYLIKKMEATAIEKEALEALAEGCAAVQDSFIRGLKDSATDKKLTKGEVVEATERALVKAKEIASGPALDLIKTWSMTRASSYIKRIIKK